MCVFRWDVHHITATFYPSQFGHVQVVDLLLEAGADNNKSKENGCTPLYVASQVASQVLKAGTYWDKARDAMHMPLSIASPLCIVYCSSEGVGRWLQLTL